MLENYIISEEKEEVKFSIGDMVTERKTNFWYLTQETAYEYYPYLPHSMSEYWDEYAKKNKKDDVAIGIVTGIYKNEPNSYFAEVYYTYSVLWTSMPEKDRSFLNSRLYLEDELRLLSKVNKIKKGEINNGSI